MDKIFEFETILIRPEGVGTWHYVDTPIQVETEFGVKGKVPVKGEINGTAFIATLIPRGNGEHYIVLDKSIREPASINVGDTVFMKVWKDNSERSVPIPEDFQLSLTSQPEAASFFASLTRSQRKGYIDWINSAKKPETRTNRIERSISLLLENKKTH